MKETNQLHGKQLIWLVLSALTLLQTSPVQAQVLPAIEMEGTGASTAASGPYYTGYRTSGEGFLL